MDDTIMVSIVTNTYNHENYIAQTLDSFVSQKTNFKFEILVHDDASTDSTANIIREYASKYPDLIKPILQTVNQYSQNVDITRNIQVKRAEGKYIALCEGDDYWCDDNKLQKQFDTMEAHPEIDICACGASVYVGEELKYNIQPSKDECIFGIDDVINGGGGFVATASLFIRKDLFSRERPEFIKIMNYDYTLQVFGSMRGGMIFLPDIMASYRLYSSTSWSNRFKKNKVARINHRLLLIKCLEQMDKDTEGKVSAVIDKKIKEANYNIFFDEKKYKKMLSSEYKEIFKKSSLKKKLYIRFFSIFSKE